MSYTHLKKTQTCPRYWYLFHLSDISSLSFSFWFETISNSVPASDTGYMRLTGCILDWIWPHLCFWIMIISFNSIQFCPAPSSPTLEWLIRAISVLQLQAPGRVQCLILSTSQRQNQSAHSRSCYSVRLAECRTHSVHAASGKKTGNRTWL